MLPPNYLKCEVLSGVFNTFDYLAVLASSKVPGVFGLSAARSQDTRAPRPQDPRNPGVLKPWSPGRQDPEPRLPQLQSSSSSPSSSSFSRSNENRLNPCCCFLNYLLPLLSSRNAQALLENAGEPPTGQLGCILNAFYHLALSNVKG